MAQEYTGEVVAGPQEYAGPVLYTGEVVPLDNRARENLPETLNVAGFDTGIKINPELAAYLASFGGRMAGSYRGAKQILGLDKGKEAEHEKLLRRLSEDPQVGGFATAGGVIGSGLDPAVLALPAVKAKSLFDMAKYGAASGAAVGAISPIEEGGSRTVNAATTAAAGRIPSPPPWAAAP